MHHYQEHGHMQTLLCYTLGFRMEVNLSGSPAVAPMNLTKSQRRLGPPSSEDVAVMSRDYVRD